MTARFIVGDVFDELAKLADGSVDLIVTSPPFLALRSYLPADHPDKAKEIGSEPTPAAFLDTLLELTLEFRRVLAPHGTLCVELGDTYAGSGGGGGDYLPGGLREDQPGFGGSAERAREGNAAHWRQKNAWKKDAGSGGAGGDYGEDGVREGQPKFRQGSPSMSRGRGQKLGDDHEPGILRPIGGGPGWPLDKCLAGIPDLYQQSLAYGWNMADPWNGKKYPTWRIRNKLAWCRPNPPVGSLGGRTLKNVAGEKIGKESGERFRSATSYVTVATVARDRWFDLDAVRTIGTEPGAVKHKTKNHAGANPSTGWQTDNAEIHQNPAGAPLLDWYAPDNFDELFAASIEDFRLWMLEMWDIWLAHNWQSLIGLPTAPYKGAHYATFPPELPRRLIEAMCPRQVCTTCGQPRRRIVGVDAYPPNLTRMRGDPDGGGGNWTPNVDRSARTLGWTDCGHNTWRPGLVLDPFAGSGTTLAVAAEHGRDVIGLDLDDRNLLLSARRIRDHVYIRTERLSLRGVLHFGKLTRTGRQLVNRGRLTPAARYVKAEWVTDLAVPKQPKKYRAIDQRSLFDLLEPDDGTLSLPSLALVPIPTLTHNPTGHPRFRTGYQIHHSDGRIQAPKAKDYGEPA